MLEPPPDIEAIWAKPGSNWTPEERDRVKNWLNSEPQLRQMQTLALKHLGQDAAWEDAEDCWGDYNGPPDDEPPPTAELVRECPIQRAIDSYDPAKGEFRAYLRLCFKQFCWRRAQRRAKSPLGGRRAEPPGDEEGEQFEWGLTDDRTPGPEAATESRESYAGLTDCLNGLPAQFKRVVTLHYFEGYSLAEIANKEGISEELVKVRLFRARQMLKKCLERKGVRP